MSQVIQLSKRSQALALRCTVCGVEAAASCNCGAVYEPASVAVARAIKNNPAKSNRAIAEIAGVTHTTVNQIRAAGGNYFPPEKVEGRDGKTYNAVRPSRPKPEVVLLEPLDYTLHMFTTYVLLWFKQLDDADKIEFWQRARKETES